MNWIKTSEQMPDDQQKVLGWYIRKGIDEDFYNVYLDGDLWKEADRAPHYLCEEPDYWCIPTPPVSEPEEQKPVFRPVMTRG